MTRWKATLSYDGTPFYGWQVQPGLPTVQQTLADALYHITGERTLPQGSGRTDAGVHALGQVASFDLACSIPGENLHHALNRSLPSSVRILTLAPVPDAFHARHSAVRKTYEYRILPRTGRSESICSPMLAPYVWVCPYRLDVVLLNEAAGHVVGEHDFTSFAAVEPDLSTRGALSSGALTQSEAAILQTHNTRILEASCWSLDAAPRGTETSYEGSSGLLRYRVTGSGFLHHMVRNLVGTFVEAGARRIPAGSIPDVLAARNRRFAGPTAPPQGLFLAEVEY